EAFSLGSRVVVLDEGRVLQEGGRDDIFERPASRRVAELVGVRNLLPARVLERGEGGAIVAWRGRPLLVQRDDLSSGTMVDLAIRSSRVLIVRADRPVPERNSFYGRIIEERLRAENYTLRFRIDGSDEPWDLEIDVPSYVYGRLGLAERKEVAVTLKAEDLHVIPQRRGDSAEPELTGP
ncbi:MAG TPA: hypothetical protein VNL92_03425, partial [Dehalococcoidia bacterium]|nr:hypothetical protein [Dehalococcoidia bacterium]